MEQPLTLGAAIIGLVNIAIILFPTMQNLHKVILAVVVGAVLPYIPLDHPSVQGIVLALGTSGAYKLTQVLRGK